uniref:U3 small nucleolar RNA-interacting protein 2 n=1 Tax=Pyrodinium bahamense TaxID=73915 RepID=A0A7S0F964_9DINO|mmetsp:Transcript_13169/g.36364  ORF Transcript_13169/g.36364 Transcript_13169/m.36364 type:complete len:445 (+) Transcript_13169:68-1402(+)
MVKRKRAAAGKAGARKKAGKKGARAAEAEAAEAADLPSDDEELPSDGEGEGQDAREDEGGDDEFFETPDEKRVRVAKEYLSGLGAAKAPEEVQQQLARDVAEHARRARVQVEDLALGEPRFLRGHLQVPTCLCLSSDERTLISGGKDCALLRWDVETGKKEVLHAGGKNKFECGGHFGFVMSVCMVEQRSLLISTGYDRLVRLWDPRASPRTACVAALQGHMACATAVVADPDGAQAYSTSLDKSLRVWDLVARRLRDTLFGHVAGATCMDLYNKGRPVSGGMDKTARLWKLDKDTHLMFSKHSYPVDAVAVLDHDSFASGSQDGSVLLWSHASKKPVASTSMGHGRWVTALAAVRRGNVLFGGSTDGGLRAWRVARPGEGEKGGLRLAEAAPTLQMPGCINAIALGRKLLACAVGKEHKLGRWFYDRTQRNGIMFVPLSYHEA